MIRVVIESPFSGDTERNTKYLRLCMADCLRRGEAPYASHALYTQPDVLDDTVPAERELGIQAGFTWAEVGHKRVFYYDLGGSRGMAAGGRHAWSLGQETEERTLRDAPELWAKFEAWLASRPFLPGAGARIE